MRYLVPVIFFLGLFVYFTFFHPDKTVDYPVASRLPAAQSEIDSMQIKYHVQKLQRFLGADIYRSQAYYTFNISKPVGEQKPGQRKLTPVLKMKNIGIRMTLDEGIVKRLELYPVFGFWQQYGRLILLVIVLVCFYFMFRFR